MKTPFITLGAVMIMLCFTACHHTKTYVDPLPSTAKMNGIHNMRGTYIYYDNYYNDTTSMYSVDYNDTIQVVSEDTIILKSKKKLTLVLGSSDAMAKTLTFLYLYQSPSNFLEDKIVYHYDSNILEEVYSLGDAWHWESVRASSY
jgi:hypothetical protein